MAEFPYICKKSINTTEMQRDWLKLVWVICYAVFAAISCWATAASFHMLLPSLPSFICWFVAVGFFIIASIGTKMIVDSFNTNIYLDRRGLRLVGGIIIVVVFWLVCSMPTNTHTFFYRAVIDDKTSQDIDRTRALVSELKTNVNNEQQAQIKISEFENKLQAKLAELETEINNEANPGNGPKAKEVLREIAKILEVDKIEPLSYKGLSRQERLKLCDAYRAKIFALARTREVNIINSIIRPDSATIKSATTIANNLGRVKGYIADGTLNLNKPEDIQEVCNKLNDGYNLISSHRDFVNFRNDQERESYVAPNSVTKVRAMVSVIDVWKDFLKGEYAGRGFLFWVIISILVDIAAFIFFDLAFRRKDY